MGLTFKCEKYDMLEVLLSACPYCGSYVECLSDGYFEEIKQELGEISKKKDKSTPKYNKASDEGTGEVANTKIFAVAELKDIKKELRIFPESRKLFPGIPTFLAHKDKGDEISGVMWAYLIVDHQWGLLIDDLTAGLATPNALFFKQIEAVVRSVFEKEESWGFKSKYADTFFLSIARETWKFICLQTIPDQVDGIFTSVEQLGHPVLQKFQRKEIRAIRSNLREHMGLDSKPKWMFSNWSAKQVTDHQVGLARAIYIILHKADYSMSMSSKIISAIWKELKIADKTADTIRTTYLHQRKRRKKKPM